MSSIKRTHTHDAVSAHLRHEKPSQEDMIAMFTRFKQIMIECAIDFLHMLEPGQEPEGHDDQQCNDETGVDVETESMPIEDEAC